MTDRESEQVKVADTPDPTWDGAGYRQGRHVGTLFQRHPVDSRQLRGFRYVVCPGTGTPLPRCLARGRENAAGKEGGGSVGA